MTAVTLLAEPVLQAEIMMHKSMKLSLTLPEAVWTMKTSLPRTESLISQRLSPTENFDRMRSHGFSPRLLQTLLRSSGWELPPRTMILRTIVNSCWLLEKQWLNEEEKNSGRAKPAILEAEPRTAPGYD